MNEPPLGPFDGVDAGRETPRRSEFDSRRLQPEALAFGQVVWYRVGGVSRPYHAINEALVKSASFYFEGRVVQ